MTERTLTPRITMLRPDRVFSLDAVERIRGGVAG